MSRTIKGSKGCGYDYWSRRLGNNGSQGYGPSVKQRTHRLERLCGKRECRKVLITISALIVLQLVGCTPGGGPPWIDRKPGPVVPVTPAVAQVVRIEVSGTGEVKVAGGAAIKVEQGQSANAVELPVVRVYGYPGHPEYDAALQELVSASTLPFQLRVIPAETPVWANGAIVLHWQASGGVWKQRAAWDGVGPFVEMWRKSRQQRASIPQSASDWTFPGNSRADLISHLQSGEHRGKWSLAYLQGLSFTELKALHSADHEGRVASVQSPSNCPGGVCPAPTQSSRTIRRNRSSDGGQFLWWSW